jgi:hypothetical protein
LKAGMLDVDVGDKVWVMFPNVGTGRSRKLAFRMHGTYIIKEWLHGAKRVALVAHESDENDVMRVHVDRMVRKKELARRLQDEWKPIKLNLVQQLAAEKLQQGEEAKAKKQTKEDVRLQKVLAEVDSEAAEELHKELEDEQHYIEKILSHRVRNGKRELRVKFVGYSRDHNCWYWEKDLHKTTPEMVEEYLAENGVVPEKAGKKQVKVKAKKSEPKRGKKAGAGHGGR